MCDYTDNQSYHMRIQAFNQNQKFYFCLKSEAIKKHNYIYLFNIPNLKVLASHSLLHSWSPLKTLCVHQYSQIVVFEMTEKYVIKNVFHIKVMVQVLQEHSDVNYFCQETLRKILSYCKHASVYLASSVDAKCYIQISRHISFHQPSACRFNKGQMAGVC